MVQGILQDMSSDSHIFDRSGIAALSDLENGAWRELFALLEKAQEDFRLKEASFRSAGYKWPADALHAWSRVWEYPYVYHHLKEWRGLLPEGAAPRVLDMGSGVTFFPFAVARLGCHVTCADIDPVCLEDLGRAIGLLPQSPGSVDVLLTDGRLLPFDSDSLDAIYCISVLEHVPDFEHAVAGMARALRPGGMLLLTVDVDLKDPEDIDRHKRLGAALNDYFLYAAADRTVHPSDMLTMNRGPYPAKLREGGRLAAYAVKHHVLKALTGEKKQLGLEHLELAVQGFCLRKPHSDGRRGVYSEA